MRATPGRRRGLTNDQIIDAVLAEGLDSFSLPSLAARLGVAHSGLYRYFDDRDDLVVQALDRLARTAPWPSVDLPWREQLEQIGETLWTLCTNHLGYDITALRSRDRSPGYVEMVTPHVESLHRQGLDFIEATAAVEFVRTLVLASSIEATRLQAISDRIDLPDHSIPGFADREKWAGRGWYQRHLNTWLDGLSHRIETAQEPKLTTAELPDWARHLATRLTQTGLLEPEAAPHELRRRLADLTHRLRYVLGEHDDPNVPASESAPRTP